MFFSKKKKGSQKRFVIYISKLAKYRNLLDYIESSGIKECYFFFESTRNEMEQLANAKGLSLEFHDARSEKKLRNKILCLEAHPLYSITQKFVDQFGEGTEVEFWMGMDESVFKLFGTDRTISLMERMGIDENEAIEHKMIVKSIERAQQKLDENTQTHQDVRTSVEEWESANGINS